MHLFFVVGPPFIVILEFAELCLSNSNVWTISLHLLKLIVLSIILIDTLGKSLLCSKSKRYLPGVKGPLTLTGWIWIVEAGLAGVVVIVAVVVIFFG